MRIFIRISGTSIYNGLDLLLAKMLGCLAFCLDANRCHSRLFISKRTSWKKVSILASSILLALTLTFLNPACKNRGARESSPNQPQGTPTPPSGNETISPSDLACGQLNDMQVHLPT